MKIHLIILCAIVANVACASEDELPPTKTRNVVLITLDGLRWQEVFRGAERRLLDSELYTAEKNRDIFWVSDAEGRRRLLMPFLWSTVAERGVIVGDRDNGSRAMVTNPWNFSYPGYSELLTGFHDPDIQSNDRVWNRNITVLEWLEKKPKFKGRVAAFGSWNVLPFVVNSKRASGIHTNFEYDNGATQCDACKTGLLKRLETDIPSPWRNGRLDAFAYHYALRHINESKPRVIYIAFGDTDEFAHHGHYDGYLEAIHRVDRFVSELWHMLQEDPQYKNQTTLILTTDHGRGANPLETWQHHASARAIQEGAQAHLSNFAETGIIGSEHIWIAMMGPDIPSHGSLTTGDRSWGINQIAATISLLLGYEYRDAEPRAGAALTELLCE